MTKAGIGSHNENSGVPKELGEQQDLLEVPVVAEEATEEKRPTINHQPWSKLAIENDNWVDKRTPYYRLFGALGDFFTEIAEQWENGVTPEDGGEDIEFVVADVFRQFNSASYQSIWNPGDRGMEYNAILAMFTALGKAEYETAKMQFSQLAEIGYNAKIQEVLADDFLAIGGDKEELIQDVE